MQLIDRINICSELNINDSSLREYENFLGFPEPGALKLEVNLANLVARLHELVVRGYSFLEIKQLALCSERFSDLIPVLRNFKDFSSYDHFRQVNEAYKSTLERFAFREQEYQKQIEILETSLKNFQLKYEEIYQEQVRSIASIRQERERLLFEIENLKEENTKFKLELDHLSKKTASETRSAIDIQALLKKKEKEIALKYQREIFDFKKQIDLMIEQKESEGVQWNKKQLTPSKSRSGMPVL